MTALTSSIIGKKAQRMTWETTIKLILFAIVLAIAISLCSRLRGAQSSMSQEHRRALAEVYQAIKHFDPQFDKTSKKILLKTNDFTIKGFNDAQFCDGSCICLCTDEYCDNLQVSPYDYCKVIDYRIADDFLIESSDSYRRIEIVLETHPDYGYLVKTGSTEDAQQES
jgi:hypothetical protein